MKTFDVQDKFAAFMSINFSIYLYLEGTVPKSLWCSTLIALKVHLSQQTTKLK